MRATGQLELLACGLRTSLGSDLAASVAAARAGLCLFAHHPYMVDSGGFPIDVARDCQIELGADPVCRLAELALCAASEALEVALPAQHGGAPLMLCLALRDRHLGPRLDAARLADVIAKALSPRAMLNSVQIFECGHVAGAAAVGAFAAAVESGYDGLGLVLGVDSWLDAEMLEWLDAQALLRVERRLFGFLPGEAAAALVLRRARPQRERTLAWLDGWAIAEEESLAPNQPRLGLALTRAWRTATDVGADPGRPIDAVYADLNGLPERADELGYATVRIGGRLADGHSLRTPAECFGDVGAASLPLMIALAAASAGTGTTPIRQALLTAQNIGHERAALLISIAEAP